MVPLNPTGRVAGVPRCVNHTSVGVVMQFIEKDSYQGSAFRPAALELQIASPLGAGRPNPAAKARRFLNYGDMS